MHLCTCVPDSPVRYRKALYFIIFKGEVVRREEAESSEHSHHLTERGPGNGNGPEGTSVGSEMGNENT